MLSIIDPLDVVAVLYAITLYNTFISSCFLVCCVQKNHRSFHFSLLELGGNADGTVIVLVDYTYKSDKKKAVKDKALHDIV
jgi:hypothetical protein